MAAQGADADEMFTAAKYVNALWFPQQAQELAMFFKATQGEDFAEVNARDVVSATFASQNGFQAVHQRLAAQGLLGTSPGGGGSCGT